MGVKAGSVSHQLEKSLKNRGGRGEQSTRGAGENGLKKKIFGPKPVDNGDGLVAGRAGPGWQGVVCTMANNATPSADVLFLSAARRLRFSKARKPSCVEASARAPRGR